MINVFVIHTLIHTMLIPIGDITVLIAIVLLVMVILLTMVIILAIIILMLTKWVKAQR